MSEKKKYTAVLAACRQVCEGTTEVVFDLGAETISFRAGQFVEITLPDMIQEDSKGSKREFSISSPPSQNHVVATVFRNSDSAYKKTLLGADMGLRAMVEGPFGVFTLPEDESIPVVLIAGGIGITPFMSIIREFAEFDQKRSLTLLYANTSSKRTAFRDELTTIANHKSNFSYVDHIGKADEELLKGCKESQANTVWYICGTPGMVTAVRQILLKKMGVNFKNIKLDLFTGY